MRGNLFGLGGREPASGTSSCTTGEVRRLKAQMTWPHVFSCAWGVGGYQGLTMPTGEKPLMAYKPDKALPESGGGAQEA